jgi:hypothetical protein
VGRILGTIPSTRPEFNGTDTIPFLRYAYVTPTRRDPAAEERAVLSLYFPVFVLVCLAVVVLRRRPGAARAFYRVALFVTALPYLLHVRFTWGFVSSFGDPQPRIGVYPGLVAFAVVGVVATLGLLAAAWILASRLPLAAAALPSALWLVYWYGVLRLAYWRAPGWYVPIDNKPLIWLFAFSALATVLLALCAWIALARRVAPDQRNGARVSQERDVST